MLICVIDGSENKPALFMLKMDKLLAYKTGASISRLKLKLLEFIFPESQNTEKQITHGSTFKGWTQMGVLLLTYIKLLNPRISISGTRNLQ